MRLPRDKNGRWFSSPCPRRIRCILKSRIGFILQGLVILVSSSRPGSAAQLELADGGSTQYVIVQAAEAGEAEVYAVEELARHLKQVTGAEFTVVSETIKQAGPRILVGPGALSRSILGKQTVDSLGAEDYVIRTVGSDLLLVGGRTRGTLYAVYHFLDNIVGIRWWAPGATFVPKKPDLHVDALDIRGEPAFEYREAFLTTAWEPDWAARNRLTGVVRRDPTIAEPVSPDAKHGGGVSFESTPGEGTTFRIELPVASG